MRVAPIDTTGQPRPPRLVVVGSDGSSWGHEAVAWAAEHAWLTGADLDTWWWDTDLSALDQVMRRYPRLRVRVHEAGADPVHDLKSASHRAALLVVGRTAGALGLGGAVLSLVRDALCDTVVVRGAPSAVHGEHRRVVALVSGGEEDEHVITRAAGAALDHGAALRVVHAVALPATGPVLDSDHRFVLDNALRLLDELDRRPPHSGVLLRVHPHEAVTHYADHDLVVVGDGGHGEAGDRSGAVTRAALHHAPSPVLVVHGRGPVHERPASTLPSARTSAEAAHALF